MMSFCTLLFLILFSINSFTLYGVEQPKSDIDALVRIFEQNPSDARNTIRLLTELRKAGRSGQVFIDRYFKTQKEADYCLEHNWIIVRDFVNDYNAPQFKYVFNNQAKFMQLYSKDDVFQKLDNVLVSHLDKLYKQSRPDYEKTLHTIKDCGYAHYDVVYDYFNIRNLRINRNAEDYFYKARKLFRYFPENRQMIKEITAGALEIMQDVSRLKVIQLWAGKTVESKADFDAIYNYVKISQKCGFTDVARKYSQIATKLANESGSAFMKQRAGELFNLINH
jgi:hypothetical protein